MTSLESLIKLEAEYTRNPRAFSAKTEKMEFSNAIFPRLALADRTWGPVWLNDEKLRLSPPEVFTPRLDAEQLIRLTPEMGFNLNAADHLKFTKGRFPGFVIAGGAVVDILNGRVDLDGDVDIFVCASDDGSSSSLDALRDPQNLGDKIEEIKSTFGLVLKTSTQMSLNYTVAEAVKDGDVNAASFLFGKRHKYQIIRAVYRTTLQLLLGFDLDCAAVAFDGVDFWATRRFLTSWETKQNLVDPGRYGASYVHRTLKYKLRYGIEPYVPSSELIRAHLAASIQAYEDLASRSDSEEFQKRMITIGEIMSIRRNHSLVERHLKKARTYDAAEREERRRARTARRQQRRVPKASARSLSPVRASPLRSVSPLRSIAQMYASPKPSSRPSIRSASSRVPDPSLYATPQRSRSVLRVPSAPLRSSALRPASPMRSPVRLPLPSLRSSRASSSPRTPPRSSMTPWSPSESVRRSPMGSPNGSVSRLPIPDVSRGSSPMYTIPSPSPRTLPRRSASPVRSPGVLVRPLVSAVSSPRTPPRRSASPLGSSRVLASPRSSIRSPRTPPRRSVSPLRSPRGDDSANPHSNYYEFVRTSRPKTYQRLVTSRLMEIFAFLYKRSDGIRHKVKCGIKNIKALYKAYPMYSPEYKAKVVQLLDTPVKSGPNSPGIRMVLRFAEEATLESIRGARDVPSDDVVLRTLYDAAEEATSFLQSSDSWYWRIVRKDALAEVVARLEMNQLYEYLSSLEPKGRKLQGRKKVEHFIEVLIAEITKLELMGWDYDAPNLSQRPKNTIYSA